MYNRYLKVFIKVADCGSFSKAAEEMYISPNAVIKQVNKYEEHLGFALFQRSHRGISLTEEGEIIYSEGKKIIKRTDKMLKEIRDRKSSSRSIVRIGNSFLFPSRSIMKLWMRIQNKCPDVYLKNIPFSEAGTNYFDERDPVWEKVDLLLVNFTTLSTEKGMNRLVLEERPLCIGMAFRHPLAEKKLLHAADLEGQTIILVQEGLSEYVDQVREWILKNCLDIHIMDSPAYDVDTFNRCVDDNILILTIQEWQDIHPSIITLPVAWDFYIPYGLLYRQNSSPVVDRFVSEIESALDS